MCFATGVAISIIQNPMTLCALEERGRRVVSRQVGWQIMVVGEERVARLGRGTRVEERVKLVSSTGYLQYSASTNKVLALLRRVIWPSGYPGGPRKLRTDLPAKFSADGGDDDSESMLT